MSKLLFVITSYSIHYTKLYEKVSDDDINELLAQVDESDTKEDTDDESLDELLNSFEDNSSSSDEEDTNIQEELDKSEALQESGKSYNFV